MTTVSRRTAKTDAMTTPRMMATVTSAKTENHGDPQVTTTIRFRERNNSNHPPDTYGRRNSILSPLCRIASVSVAIYIRFL
uniref:Uncharacterized protein n=1 Tax=Panagrellus redivivus TaxID=6233 RepID=A0A7E4W7Y0_PANRE